MKDLIKSLREQGKTVVLCSHLLADVQDVCDRITILFRGKMMTLGPVRDLIQVRDVTQVQTRTMTAGQLEDMRIYLAKAGMTEAVITHPTTTLEDLFLRIVKENTPAGHSSVGSA
jgi:ABC-2 type transport system ATP-binding protein